MKKSEKRFISEYENKEAYVREYIKASLKRNMQVKMVCSMVTFVCAAILIGMRLHLTLAVLLLVVGVYLVIDNYYLSVSRHVKKTLQQYQKIYGTVNVHVKACASDNGLEYTINENKKQYSYEDIVRVEGTEHLIVFVAKDGIVPFLRDSFSVSNKQALKTFITKKGRQAKNIE